MTNIMVKQNIFLNKFGMLILIVLGLLIFISTCNSCGAIDKTNKRIAAVEKTLVKQDSIISTMLFKFQKKLFLQITQLSGLRRDRMM